MINENFLLVADIGGTRIRLAFIGVDSETIIHEPEEYWSAILQDGDPITPLVRILKDYMYKTNITPVGIVVGLPGIVDIDKDVVLRCNNIPSLVGRKLAIELSESLKKPVFIEHDTKLLLAGELSTITIRDDDISLGIFMGTGVGADVIVANRTCQVFSNGFELGHIPLTLHGEKCVCGKKGCAETFVSGHKLEALCKTHDVHITEAFKYWKEDSAFGNNLQTFVDYQAMIIAIAMTIINPTVLVLGGGVLSMRNYPKEYVEKSIKKHVAAQIPSRILSVHWASLGHRSGFYGGLHFYRRNLAKST